MQLNRYQLNQLALMAAKHGISRDTMLSKLQSVAKYQVDALLAVQAACHWQELNLGDHSSQSR
jgi:hypothetical protein